MGQPSRSDLTNAGMGSGALLSQMRECYGRVAYSHKAHEKSADIYLWRLRAIKLAQVVLSAITTGGLFATLFGPTTGAAVVAALASTVLLAVNLYSKEHSLGELIQKHVTTASALWGVRESYLSLIVDLFEGASPDGIREKRDRLQPELEAIYRTAPRTLSRAYAKAQKALQFDEELTFSDAEIDRLLPPVFRESAAHPLRGER